MSPVTALCLALVAGVALAPLWPFGPSSALACGALATGLACLASRAGRRLALAASALVATAAAGLALAAEDRSVGPPAWKPVDHVLVGRVERVRPAEDGRVRIHLALAGASAAAAGRGLAPGRGEARISAAEERARALRRGQVILLRARALWPRRLANFDDGRARPPPVSGRLVAGPLLLRPQPFSERVLERARVRVRRGLEAALVDRDARALALALVLGDRSLLREEVVDAFRRTGTAHILAVSGFNVSIATGLVVLVLRWVLARVSPLARRYRVSAAAAVLAVPAAWGYAALTGLEPPVHRAAIMASAALLASALARPGAPFRALSLAAVAILGADPELLSTPGFQLSFVAVLGLLAVARRGREGREEPTGLARRLLRGLGRAAVTSIAATLATAPLVAYHFGQASPAGLLVNVAAVPAMGLLVFPPTLVVTAVAALWPAVGALLSPVAALPLCGLLASLRWVAALPGAACFVGRPSLLETLLLTGAGIAAVRWGRRGLPLLAIVVVVAAGALGLRVAAPAVTGRLRVTFLDVGDGTATIVDLPRGGRLLVDAGPAAGVESIPPAVVEALERTGVSRLRALVLSHGHADHVSGAASALRRVGAAALWQPLPGTGREVGPYERLARGQGAEVREAATLCGSHRIGPVRLEVLHPCEGRVERLGENDRSLVLRFVLGEVAVLLPGDVEGAGEAALLRLGADRLRADVMELPHHGSATSTSEALLDAVRPRVAVASCGRVEGRSLPHPSVEARLRRRGARVLSTVEHGAVRVSTDGRDLRVRAVRVGEVTGGRRGVEEAWLRLAGM